jgi:HEAT repeat protein
MDVQSQEAHSPAPAGGPPTGGPPAENHPGDSPVKAVAAWINQFARTLKTSRLYHASNPTVVRFREELTAALTRLIDEVGPITYKFTADDILFADVSLHPAKSRDDNLAFPFHRDGVRALTFNPGISARELDALLDALMLVTGQAQIDDDLVTLLWQANLKHVDVDYVPAERDVGSGSTDEGGVLLPWPTAAVAGEDDAPEGGGATPEGDATATAPGTGSRSDDWTTGELTTEIEAGFAELDALAPDETGRFRDEFAAEHEVSLMTTALAIARAYLDAGATAEDRAELARFLPRMLRLSIGEGSWLEAREALALLRECDGDQWSVESFTQELFQPISVAATVEQLDRQEPAQVVEFIALAKELGEPALDWLNLALAESQHRRTQRLLAEAVTELCRENPERIAPWLADPRWYVVRNAVQVLGRIGGDLIVGLLQAAMRHRDPRVRPEVVAALGQVDPATARPLLLELLPGADTRLFCSILHQLSFERDTPTAQMLVGYLQDPSFEQRPDDEKRAIYAALAAVGTDDVLPQLEAELAKGNWLTPGIDAHRQAIARCIARVGTIRARALLERGAESKRAALREVCAEALRSVHVRD